MGHGHVQHSGASWNGVHTLPYRIYILLIGADLRDVFAFANGALGSSHIKLSGTDEGEALEMSGMSRSVRVPIAVVTVTPGILHLVLALW